MHKDTIITKGRVGFITSNDIQNEETLIFLLEVFKSHMNARFDIDGYNESFNPCKTGACEHGRITSIKESDYHHRILKNEDHVPFYLHSRDIRISTILDDIITDINMIGNYDDGTLDGLVIDIKKYVTTFDNYQPEINVMQLSSTFEFDGDGGYRLKIVNSHTIPIQTTIDSLNSFTDIFCFSTDSRNSLKPFLLLLENVIKSAPEDIFGSDSAVNLASLLVNSITYDLDSPYSDITLESLCRLIISQTDVKLSIGPKNAINVFKKIAPVINRSLMTTGGL